MTRIKICGITNVEDARAAVDYGADALGFILVPESPRYIDENTFHTMGQINYLFVDRVVVVQRPSDAQEYAYDYVQFYREEDGKQDWWYDSWQHIRAFRIQDEKSLDEIESYRFHEGMRAYLLDAYHKDKQGGSGEIFNWDLAVEAKRRFGKPIILAGGLTPENVGEAIAKVRPYAVDVSSGVEAEPGRKDHVKLKAFIDAVKEADRLLNT